MQLIVILFLLAIPLDAQILPTEYRKRVTTVTQTPGFVALWDFVKRDGDRFDAWKSPREKADLRLDAVNYVQQFWGEGRTASYADIPVVSEGPFGQAVALRNESDPTFRPLLLVPRERLHGSGLDVKGAHRSVTLVVWIKRAPDSGTHAIAGIWHEGTDLRGEGTEAKRVERGKRQYALFAGLAANPHGAASHISDNGASSFGDKYARHLSVTKDELPLGEWVSIALVFDNDHDTVTSYLNGEAQEYWAENPQKHPFFQYAARAWARGEYSPPKQFVRIEDGELKALKVNPYWFPYDLYDPATIEAGGPFTIGRVIHTGRNATAPGLIGGVAVFSRPLRQRHLRKLVFGGPATRAR